MSPCMISGRFGLQFCERYNKMYFDYDFQQKLWEYIRDGRLDLVTSDHSPSVAELKNSNFLEAWGGVSSMQFGKLNYYLLH